MKKIIIFIFLLSGCAAAPSDPNNLVGIKTLPNKALLIAQNDAWGKALVPLQTQNNSHFEKLNGKKISTFTNTVEKIEVKPGKHTLDVYCSFRRGTALHLTNSQRVSSKFEAGKIYLFNVIIENGTCGISVVASS
jgi:hypothetical protein